MVQNKRELETLKISGVQMSLTLTLLPTKALRSHQRTGLYLPGELEASGIAVPFLQNVIWKKKASKHCQRPCVHYI